MSQTDLKLTIVEKTHIAKYAEGVDPSTGDPYEIVENSRELSLEEALPYLKQLQEAGKLNLSKEDDKNAIN